MSVKEMIAGYDRDMIRPLHAAYYDHSDFYNYGYWSPGTLTQGEASLNLVEKLLSFIPEKHGRILDVACGLGASTRHLLQYYAPQDIVGINLSAKQLTRARENAPSSNLLIMNAARLGFADASFDTVLCVEAAFHFETRDLFLAEANRVLKPGGRLVTSDILFRPSRFSTAGGLHFPAENCLPNIAAFKDRLAAAGFDDILVEDATRECWGGFSDYLRRAPGESRRKGSLDLRGFLYMSCFSLVCRMITGYALRYYVLTSSRKPA